MVGRVPGLGVRIPLWALMSVHCERYVLSGRGHYDGPITLTEDSHWVCVCVSECDREATATRRPRPIKGSCAIWGGGELNVSTVQYGKIKQFTVSVWDNWTISGSAFTRHIKKNVTSIAGRQMWFQASNTFFRNVTQFRLVVPTDVSGQHICPIQGSNILQNLVNDCQSILCNKREDRRSQEETCFLTFLKALAATTLL